MQSLRTRRSEAPGKSQRPQARLAKPNGNAPTPRRDTRKSRVDDKIKKRMSMRYADISAPTELNVPPIPAMPGLPSQTAGKEQDEVVMDRNAGRKDRDIEDKKFLDKDDFDPDAYLKVKLANSTESELKTLQASLRNAKDDTDSDLRRNVFKNYAEFVMISKEITTLENEMMELKESLSEYKSMPSLLHIPDPASTSSSGLSSYRRSSVADLRIMYFNQMQTLHAQIEGSAKFAPTTPGRHVVGEVEGVIALNAATYKPTGKVKFVLVARRRRRAGGGGGSGRDGGSGANEGKLVAERCWPLNEMLVLDTKDSPSMTNVFKIRQETPADKKSLLSQFRHGEHERRKSMWNGGGADFGGGSDRVPAMPDWMADLASKVDPDRCCGLRREEKAERDARWVGEWADELTVAIALREWEKATGLVETGKGKLTTTPPLAGKLPPLTAQLTCGFARLPVAAHQPQEHGHLPHSRFCLRLNAGPAARTAFLNMRSQVMRNHGHIGAYVGDLAVVYFTGIKHTADWFLASFKENEVASAFIDWAKKQIEDYGELFRRQVYSSDADPKMVDEALKITYSQSKKLLQEYGLDFRFLSPSPRGIRPHHLISPRATSSARRSTPAHSPPSSAYTPSAFPPNSVARDRDRDGSRDNPPPMSAMSARSGFRAAPPGTAPPLTIVPGLPMLASPTPRRTRSPPPSAGFGVPPPSAGLPTPRTPGGARERPPRVARGAPSPGPVPPPPRSTNRPGSTLSRPPPVAVPQREGMI
ncbi:hypothetical protein C8F04DRAFT_1208688 [Mycena alexandri]|uniref:Exocyst complex component EXO84 n=1 Tax=Mycena alexandri TaxID=1745969 RepID=A0AAD6T5Q7_9AGAR|nr:hypothetical protein C8F04DRAFT_1208688 [Mycena alexandri]